MTDTDDMAHELDDTNETILPIIAHLPGGVEIRTAHSSANGQFIAGSGGGGKPSTKGMKSAVKAFDHGLAYKHMTTSDKETFKTAFKHGQTQEFGMKGYKESSIAHHGEHGHGLIAAAHAASHKAWTTGHAADHEHAQKAHEAAATHAYKSNHNGQGRQHENYAEQHKVALGKSGHLEHGHAKSTSR